MNALKKVVYYKSKVLKNGNSPVVVWQVINGKRVTRTLFNLPAKYWDGKNNRVKGTYPRAAQLNKIIIEALSTEENINAPKRLKLTVGECLDVKLATLMPSQERYIKIINAVKPYADEAFGLNTPADELNAVYISRFAAEILGKGRKGKTLKLYLQVIKTALAAQNIQPPKDAFKIKIPQDRKSARKLTAAEFARVEAAELPAQLQTARAVFCLQVYLRGSRISDVLALTPESLQNGMVTVHASKTKTYITVPVTAKIQAALQILFRRKLTPCNINIHLEKIAAILNIPRFTSHSARHTFAKLAIDKINNPMITMQLLGHSSIAVHQNYIQELNNDDMLNDLTNDILDF